MLEKKQQMSDAARARRWRRRHQFNGDLRGLSAFI
jgi:hypothetical protein